MEGTTETLIQSSMWLGVVFPPTSPLNHPKYCLCQFSRCRSQQRRPKLWFRRFSFTSSPNHPSLNQPPKNGSANGIPSRTPILSGVLMFRQRSADNRPPWSWKNKRYSNLTRPIARSRVLLVVSGGQTDRPRDRQIGLMSRERATKNMTNRFNSKCIFSAWIMKKLVRARKLLSDCLRNWRVDAEQPFFFSYAIERLL